MLGFNVPVQPPLPPFSAPCSNSRTLPTLQHRFPQLPCNFVIPNAHPSPTTDPELVIHTALNAFWEEHGKSSSSSSPSSPASSWSHPANSPHNHHQPQRGLFLYACRAAHHATTTSLNFQHYNAFLQQRDCTHTTQHPPTSSKHTQRFKIYNKHTTQRQHHNPTLQHATRETPQQHNNTHYISTDSKESKH